MKGKIVTFARFDEATQRKGIKLELEGGEEKWFSWFGKAERANELFGKIEKGDLVEIEVDKTKVLSFKKAGDSPAKGLPDFVPANKYGKSEEEKLMIARQNALTNATNLTTSIFEVNKVIIPNAQEIVLKIAQQYVDWITQPKKEEAKKP